MVKRIMGGLLRGPGGFPTSLTMHLLSVKVTTKLLTTTSFAQKVPSPHELGHDRLNSDETSDGQVHGERVRVRGETTHDSPPHPDPPDPLPQTIAMRCKQIENGFCDCLRERGLFAQSHHK